MSNRKIERINDDQLAAQLNAVRAHIRRTRKHGGDTRDAEVELCYLEREEEHRNNATSAHKAYEARIREELYAIAREEEEAINEFLQGESHLFNE
jgi:hypothetical protein